MTERARVQELLEQRVAALARVSADLALDPEHRLDGLANSVANTSTAVACTVVLVDDRTDTLHVGGSPGLPSGYVTGLIGVLRAGAAELFLEGLPTRRASLVRDVRRLVLTDPRCAPLHAAIHQVAWDAVYTVPLVSRGRAVGVLHFYYLPGREPGDDEKVFLRAVADQTAVGVEKARLLAEAHGKAALEERQRLARELHDSVSQALYGIALGTKTARALLDSDPPRAAAPLDYVLSLTEAGLAEMRALIFELRPESLAREGLVAALDKQAAALAARHGLRVEAQLCEEPEAPLETKEAVYRITQEALHNTVKHARATDVHLVVRCDDGSLVVDVRDDGVGFDPSAEFPGQLGLRSMRERAAAAGGVLDVQSVPDRGTRVRAVIPL